MIIKKRIPPDFYKLFRTKNMEAYMQFMIAIYEENSAEYTAIGLTAEECKLIIDEQISKSHIKWEEDENIDEDEQIAYPGTPSFILGKLVNWGWLKSDFDEKLNSDVISFPEYSLLYVELFIKLQNEDDSRERESILAIYSALYTYKSDNEKNNEMLKNAYQTSKRLGQLLSNMQDGMRGYFEELSGQKSFIGIQEVLINEINNSDSKKYAILTTTDSFYRYKEEVKELIDQILDECDKRRIELERKAPLAANDTVQSYKNARALEKCEEAVKYVNMTEREFDLMERRYNYLVEQKSIFAKRALARIHFIMNEDNTDEDSINSFIRILNRSEYRDEVIDELSSKVKVSVPFKNLSDASIYNRKNRNVNEFRREPLPEAQEEERSITDFVPKPLYTKKELAAFKEKNMINGRFEATNSTVDSVEDLEKLLFLWQEATNIRAEGDGVSLGEDIHSENGLTFSKLIIDK